MNYKERRLLLRMDYGKFGCFKKQTSKYIATLKAVESRFSLKTLN